MPDSIPGLQTSCGVDIAEPRGPNNGTRPDGSVIAAEAQPERVCADCGGNTRDPVFGGPFPVGCPRCGGSLFMLPREQQSSIECICGKALALPVVTSEDPDRVAAYLRARLNLAGWLAPAGSECPAACSTTCRAKFLEIVAEGGGGAP